MRQAVDGRMSGQAVLSIIVVQVGHAGDGFRAVNDAGIYLLLGRLERYNQVETEIESGRKRTAHQGSTDRWVSDLQAGLWHLPWGVSADRKDGPMSTSSLLLFTV